MKYFYLIFIMFCTRPVLGQYGQEGAILAASETVIRALELSELDKIAQAQSSIVIYHGAIAASTAELVRIEQQKLDAKSELRTWIENMSSAIRVGTTAQQLYELQQQILDLAGNVPEIVPFVTETMVQLLLDATAIITDFTVALKEGSTNLMDNASRIEIINTAQEGLDYLVGKSLKLYSAMQAISHISLFEDGNPDNFQYDIEGAYQRALQRTVNLIQQ